jgi:hypothetical protein
MPTGPREARPDDRLRIEPGISSFPDVQLRIRGLVLTHHPGMTQRQFNRVMRSAAFGAIGLLAWK